MWVNLTPRGQISPLRPSSPLRARGEVKNGPLARTSFSDDVRVVRVGHVHLHRDPGVDLMKSVSAVIYNCNRQKRDSRLKLKIIGFRWFNICRDSQYMNLVLDLILTVPLNKSINK
jgi:hypothetical protein